MTLTSLHFFFFNDTATTEIYTLSLHDALPISRVRRRGGGRHGRPGPAHARRGLLACERSERATSATRSSSADRKSTRLNSSHLVISYAVFCLKKKTYKQSALQLECTTSVYMYT